MPTAYDGPALAEQLRGAKIIGRRNGFTYAWHGGHGVHIYREDGFEIDYYTTGDWSKDAATTAEVRRSLKKRGVALDA